MTSETRSTIYYGWILLGVCALSNFFILGVRFSSGVYLKPMSVELGWSRTLISQAFALSNLLVGLYQPFVGRMLDRWGGRVTIGFTALLAAIVTSLISLTQAPWHYFLLFGVIYPLGQSGSTLGAASALLQRWFKRYRATAIGIVSSGASAGQLVIAPLFTFTMIQYGWRSSIFTAGIIILVFIVPLLFIFVREYPEDLGLRPDGASPDDADSGARSAAAEQPPVNRTLREASGTLPFWLLCSGYFVCGWTVGMVSAHIAAYLDDLGFAREIGGYVLAIIGGMNIVGTLTMGTIADRFGHTALPLGVVYFIRGIAFMILVFSQTLTAVLLFAFVVGFAWFSTVPLTYSLAGKHFGLRNLGVITGTLFLSHQVGSGISIALAGWWAEYFGSYNSYYLIGACFSFAAAVCSALIAERQSSDLVPSAV